MAGSLLRIQQRFVNPADTKSEQPCIHNKSACAHSSITVTKTAYGVTPLRKAISVPKPLSTVVFPVAEKNVLLPRHPLHDSIHRLVAINAVPPAVFVHIRKAAQVTLDGNDWHSWRRQLLMDLRFFGIGIVLHRVGAK